MSARMEKVREALDVMLRNFSPGLAPTFDAALAEVEEWEAEVQRLGDDVAEQALRIIDLGQKENEAVARAEAAEAELARVSKEYADWKEAWNRREVACEAAEAEADRLKASLTELRDAHELLKASRAKDMYDARLDALSRKAHGDPHPEIP